MSIEGIRQGLAAINEGATAIANDAIAVTQQERFASLPARCARAGELALELSGLLREIYEDGEAYVTAAQPFVRPDSASVSYLGEQARAITEQADNETLQEIPKAIDRMGNHFIPVASALSGRIRTAEGYVTRIDRIAKGTGHLGKYIERITDYAVTEYRKEVAIVGEIVTGELDRLDG